MRWGSQKTLGPWEADGPEAGARSCGGAAPQRRKTGAARARPWVLRGTGGSGKRTQPALTDQAAGSHN